jgi:hypothetical protein
MSLTYFQREQLSPVHCCFVLLIGEALATTQKPVSEIELSSCYVVKENVLSPQMAFKEVKMMPLECTTPPSRLAQRTDCRHSRQRGPAAR